MSPASALDHASVVEALAEAADRDADLEAYVEPATPGRPRRVLTFGQWDRAANGVAGLLARAGVGPGDVVALHLPSSILYAVTYAATLRLGAVASGLNPRLGPGELASILDRLRPTVTVAPDGVALAPDLPFGRVLPAAEVEGAVDGPSPSRPVAVHGDEVVAVVWTSGTAGQPKGAVFDHATLRAVAVGTDVLGRPGDRRLSPLPFVHVGYMTRLWDEIAHRITTVITPTPWRAAEALAALEAEAVTVAQGVPAQWRLLLDLPRFDQADLSHLRLVGTGAARVPPALVAELRQRLAVPVVVRYTSTESCLGTGTSPADPDEVVATTVGQPVPGVELAVVDEGGRPVPARRPGRVRLRSGAVMRGYVGRWPSGRGEALTAGDVVDQAATAAVLDADGWLTTGDLGFLTEEGHLVLVGRESEMYIRGGYNVYPAEVERVLAEDPSVAQVVVVGTPDPVLGEVGVAFVVPTPGSEAPTLEGLVTRCRGVLADYKAPDALVVLDDMPVTAMMKPDRRALERAAAEAVAKRWAGRARPPGVDRSQEGA